MPVVRAYDGVACEVCGDERYVVVVDDDGGVAFGDESLQPDGAVLCWERALLDPSRFRPRAEKALLHRRCLEATGDRFVAAVL